MLTAAIEASACGRTMCSVVDCEPASTIGECATEIDPVFAANAPWANTSAATAAAAAIALFMLSSFRPETVGERLRSRPLRDRNYGSCKGFPRTFQYPCR